MMTPRRVQQLVREGVIPKAERGQYPLVGSIQGYIHYLQKQLQSGAKKLDEDARLRAAQADLRTLELAEKRGDLVSAVAIIDLIKELQPVYFSDIDAIPARLTPDLVGRTEASEIRRTLEDEVKRVRQSIHDGLVRIEALMGRRSRPKRAAKKKTARRVGRQRKDSASRAR